MTPPPSRSDDGPDAMTPAGDRPDACPRTTAWIRLSAGSADAAEEVVLLDHLATCPACPTRLDRIAAEWAPVTGLPKTRDHDSTTRIVDSIAGREPPREPRPTLPPPQIPGLADLEEVGSGGMGVVYKAREERLGRTVAVKVLSGGAARSLEGHRRAEREARILTRIAHPNIVQILYVTESQGAPAIVMEWIDGPSLQERRRQAPIPVREAVAIVADLARAVSAVHACGIVHRDIKPANVLLAAPPPGRPSPTPKLVDFGLARPDDDLAVSVTRASVTVGTPSFMAPEQTGLAPELGSVGPATDIHALGALLYWMLGGRAPYEERTTAAALKRAAAADAPRLSTLVPRLPADLATIVDRCLAQRPERRYRSADALADDLSRYLEGRPVHARPIGRIEHLLKWARRRPALAALSASATVALLALAAGTVYHVRSLERARLSITASRDEALAAEDLARRSFDMLTDASAERLLARNRPLDEADRDHLRQIATQYRQWPVSPDEPAGWRFRAAGLERLSRIFARLNWSEDALAAASAAREALDAGGLETAEDDAKRLALLHMETGRRLQAGRYDEAAAALRPVIERIEASSQRSPKLDGALVIAIAELAVVEDRVGKLEEARRLFERSVALADRRIAESPEDPERLADSVPVLYNAAVSQAINAVDAKKALYEALRQHGRAGLTIGQARRFDLGKAVVLGSRGLAEHALWQNRFDEALGPLRDMTDAARELAGEMPEHFTGDMIWAASRTYDSLAALGRATEAEPALEEAVALAERALDAEPALIERTRALAGVLEVQAAMLLATGRRAEAIRAHRRILEAILPWTVGEGGDDFFRASLSRTRERIEQLEADEAAASAAAE